tara:strand:- start:25404 stop:26570 length:1167 start_codon:yes stop_codon:yes gene_type:complete
MAETQSDRIGYRAPPQGIRDLYFGAGPGVPGMYPLLNQATSNYFSTMGMPGMTPYSYQGNRIAGFTPMQRQAMGMAGRGVGSYLPFYQRGEQMLDRSGRTAQGAYDTAAGMYGQGLDFSMPAIQQGLGSLGGAQGYTQQAAGMYDPSRTSEFMNPYMQQVIDPITESLREQTEQQKQAINQKAISAGAFGNRRADMLTGEAERAGQRAMGETVGKLLAGGYGQAVQDRLASAEGMRGIGGQMGNIAGAYGSLGGLGADVYGQYGRNLGTQGMNLATMMGNLGGQYQNMGANLYGLGGQDINRMMNVGNMQQQMQQRYDDLAYQNFMGQYALPYQTLGQAFNIGNQALPYMGGVTGDQAYTTTAGGSNPFLDWASVGLGAYGAYKNATS